MLTQTEQKILIELLKDENYVRGIEKEISITYWCVLDNVNRLEKKGLVELKRIGRKKQVVLTEMGKKVAQGLKILR